MNSISLENSLSGYVQLHKDLIYIKNHNIVMRNDDEFKKDEKSVIIISGGGSGHEPFPISFIGKGSLNVAVCGELFTSPSVTSCLASILLSSQNNPKREILIFINNYTGDRLNFGLAIEKARTIYKYEKIKAITIDDDCAIDNPPNSTGRRGLTAINIAIKVAGALVAQGYTLDRIHEYCSYLLCKRMIRSIGFSFQYDNVNATLRNINIGYGIHGESGSLKINYANCFNSIIAVLLEKLKIDDIKCDKIALLFNNLGGASEFIFSHFIKEFMEFMRKYSFNVVSIYRGQFLSSLNAQGIGISLIKCDDDVNAMNIVALLDYPCTAASGHLFNSLRYDYVSKEIEFHIPKSKQIEFCEKSLYVTQHEIVIAKKILMKVCEAVNYAKAELNEIDREFGDGDTGTTISNGSKSILNAIEMLNFSNPHFLLIALSDILMKEMGGTSGAVFSIFFQCASNAFNERNEYSIENWLNAISLGIKGIIVYGKAQFNDRTLLDSLKSGYEAMNTAINESSSTLKCVEAFAKGCNDGAEKTKYMRAKSGRAAYSAADNKSNMDYKYPDSGAMAISIIAKTINNVYKGE
ncbi:hypothetical protein PVAND_009219 [Polypedilum vanderplanki]|uniref:Triokinase/FMN cyclase n=1 Tax=Polypedilum vanderplanki TaxID=319348 RepID=A0A9J6CCU0_POLVA|nr:hypothetical protein PVAND_009219 [Polypedilum vanderplanki]